MSLRAVENREVWNGAVATWCAFWLVVGIWTGFELFQLAELGSTLADSGRALDSAGTALQSLDSLPVVGDSAAELGREVSANASDIVEDGGQVQGSLRQVGFLLGVTISLVPTVPAVVLLTLRRKRTGGVAR